MLLIAHTLTCIRSVLGAVHFFYIGGILSLPYQFYHHAHKMLCDRDQSEKLFLFDTDHHGVYSLLTIQTILTVHNPLPYCPCGNHAACYTQINASVFAAVVMIGKGLTR